MGFNFGAMLGGAADQIVKDIDDRETEVKLRTRTILDRHVAETAANRKEYKTNKKKVTEQLNSIANYFGADDPDRYNKARAIVAGGDSHVAKMSTAFTQAQMSGQDVNEIYKFTKSDKDVGFKGVEDTTNSLVKLATIAAPSFGASEQTSTLFGSTNLANVYEQGRSQYEKAGLLDVPASTSESGATYGSGQLDLTALKQDAKSLDQQIANANRDMNENKPGSPEHIKAKKKLDDATKTVFKTSATIEVARITAEAEAKGNIPSLSGYTTIHTKGLDSITKKYEQKIVTGPDNQIVADPAKIALLRQAEINSYNKSFVKGLIRNGLDTNATDLINSTPALAKVQDEVMTELEAEIMGDKKPITKEDKKPVVNDNVNKVKDIVKNNTTINQDVVNQLVSINPKGNPEKLKQNIAKLFPKPDGVDDAEYKNQINSFVSKAFKFKSPIKAKGWDTPNRAGLVPRPDQIGNTVDEKAWDEKYGKTRNRDGTPKTNDSNLGDSSA
jgi:hypothetical protein